MYKENNIVIGYFETTTDSMKFKLRKPVQVLKDELSNTTDTRFVERGVVCDTKNKQDLLQILANLGVSRKHLTDVRVKNICSHIRNRIIELEIKERGRGGRYKYMYSWWDEMPNLLQL